ncbi:MAG: 3-oxoacyl-ACP synthase [Legionellaceae bacterium]|nr:3-oxoacyl-ACP synthase [Legionellaceae bacterium]HAF87673.1 3-oxoacyl-ACP synthase [Legionellales bacterium]HCA89164.1 3-oxoacyl-ACP synthase [Legionellales bacterium]|tara:strand:+ start:669 stop:1622 length:954 start_codon:yes stop_codon:yes gene_type:complete
MTHAFIQGTGSYLPQKFVSNHDLAKTLDTSDEWIYTRTGIKGRYIASKTETTSFMAAQAAHNAMTAASLAADKIDFIIVATCTPDYIFPGVACYVQHALGIQKAIPCLDINAACSGFIYALDLAHQYIQTNRANHVLVIGSESMSQAVDWQNRATCVLFGDGAGAAVVSKGDRQGIISSILHATYDHQHFLSYANSALNKQSAYIHMQGHDVFKLAVNRMGEVVDEVLNQAHLTQKDIDWLVPHQANIRIIQGIAKKLKLPLEQVIVTIEHQGNTSAASIPLALDSAIKQQKIQRDDILLLESFGGGMTWGAMVIRY